MHIDNEKREKHPMGRFEIICERYINGTRRDREIILSFLSEEEKQAFLVGCGLFHMFWDQRYYDTIKKAVGEQLYKDLHKSPDCLAYGEAYCENHIVCGSCNQVFNIMDNCTEIWNFCPCCGADMREKEDAK